MGVGKQHAAGGEPIKIRSVNALSAAHAVDPVIQVIDGDEEHIRAFGREAVDRRD